MGESRADGTRKACTSSIQSVVAAHTRNWSQIFIGAISLNEHEMHVGNVIPLTRRPGYNNQPIFSNDGRGVYYSWRPDGSEADIWYHDIRTGKESAITCTPQDEYSPMLMPGRDEISVVSLEDQGKRRLWRIPLGGGQPSPLFANITSVAYYAWADADTVVLNLTDAAQAPTLTLAIGKVLAGSLHRIGSAIT